MRGRTEADSPEHVEIYPIELKLDYKPKRVDFAALREGKTMELMNFFHFDGAEMTLRHITLSGVYHFLVWCGKSL
jgi:autophagy-related protein 2